MMSQGVTQESLRDVSRMFKGCISRFFQVCYKIVKRAFHVCYEIVKRMLKSVCYKSVSRVYYECIEILVK